MRSPETSQVPQSYRFVAPLKEGRIVSRPNRFIMIIRAGGRTLKCHCPTTGRIGDVELAGLPCLYSTSTNPKRKTSQTVEAISTTKGSWIGINQTASNRYLEFFLAGGALAKMVSGPVSREVRLGRSRIDFLVGDTYVEVKTPLITLPAPGKLTRVKRSRFDSFDRLVKHMGELRRSLSGGRRAIILLCYLYDAKPFRTPVRDNTNSKILNAANRAEKAGVERWHVNLKIDREGVSLIRYFRNSPR